MDPSPSGSSNSTIEKSQDVEKIDAQEETTHHHVVNLTHSKSKEGKIDDEEANEETEARIKVHTQLKDADATLAFQEQYDSQVPPITPEQEKKLSRKLCWIIISFIALMNLVLYMTKGTLSYASLMEMWDDTGLTQTKYNNINTIFYAGYTVGQIPGNYLIQKLPVGLFAFILVAGWSIITFLTCTCTNYPGVVMTRFFLGFMQSVAVPTMNTTLGQFLNASEKAASGPLFFSTCMGYTIPQGFIAYGVMYANSNIKQWQILYIIIGCFAALLAALIWFFYPNNPQSAKFLSLEEKIWVIRRVQETTGSAIEQKTYKRHQLMETLKDPVSWLFGLYFLLLNLANNLPYQQNLLFEEMGGISNLDSTLVSVASGGFSVVCSLISAVFLMKFPNTSAFSTVFWTLPSLVGSICAVALPWGNKIGILANLTMASPLYALPWIIMFSWAGTSCSGYTKKMTRNIFTMVGYGIGNLISPQLWKESDSPRYKNAWVVQIILSFGVAPMLAIVIYIILKRRNIQRLAEMTEDDKMGVIEESDGERVIVNVAALDLTDLENKTFIYPL